MTNTPPPYSRTAGFYDTLYVDQEHFPERLLRLDAVIADLGIPDGGSVLDVACGTGLYLAHLRDRFQMEGVDLSAAMLAIARERCPGNPLHQGDMLDFELNRTFDATLCLGSSIGYVRTLPRLRTAIANLARHTRPGGTILVEPWITPAAWRPGFISSLYVDRADFKLARMSVSAAPIDNVSVLDYHFLIAHPGGIESFVERHDMGLFSVEDHLAAFAAAGLSVRYDPYGLGGRGLYIATKPSTP